MRKKIMASVLTAILLFTHFAVIAEATTSDFTRNNKNKLYNTNVITLITDKTSVDSKYSAKSIAVPNSKIKICNYGTTTAKSLPNLVNVSYDMNDVENGIILEDDGTNKHDSKGYTNSWFMRNATDDVHATETDQSLYWNITIDSNLTDSSKEEEKTISNVATIIYQGGLEYNGKIYDIRLDIEEISVQLNPKSTNNKNPSPEIQFRVGKRAYQSNNLGKLSTYTDEVNPQIGVRPYTNSTQKANVKVKYYALDGNKVIPFSGVFGITDIDLNQGVFIENFKVSKETAFMYPRTMDNATAIDRMYYTNLNNGAYIYYYNSNSGADATVDNTLNGNAYGLIDVNNSMNLTFTWDQLKAYSSIIFMDDVLKLSNYKVEHLFQQDNGTYKVNDQYTESLREEVGKTVSAEALKNIPSGYTYNATRTGNENKGVVKEDGSLVLRLYYDKIPEGPKNATYAIQHITIDGTTQTVYR